MRRTVKAAEAEEITIKRPYECKRSINSRRNKSKQSGNSRRAQRCRKIRNIPKSKTCRKVEKQGKHQPKTYNILPHDVESEQSAKMYARQERVLVRLRYGCKDTQGNQPKQVRNQSCPTNTDKARKSKHVRKRHFAAPRDSRQENRAAMRSGELYKMKS